MCISGESASGMEHGERGTENSFNSQPSASMRASFHKIEANPNGYDSWHCVWPDSRVSRWRSSSCHPFHLRLEAVPIMSMEWKSKQTGIAGQTNGGSGQRRRIKLNT